MLQEKKQSTGKLLMTLATLIYGFIPPFADFNHTHAANPLWPGYRIKFGDPFLIEDVLVKYPKLKLYLMHAGENFYENTLRMMDGYPNLYADLGVEMWLHPMTKDFAVKFLKSAKEYRVLDRVMFGSDQMVWPEAITSSINFLNALSFLTKKEKKMIFYKNAKKFLGIDK